MTSPEPSGVEQRHRRQLRTLYAAGFVTAFGAHAVAANLGGYAIGHHASLLELGILGHALQQPDDDGLELTDQENSSPRGDADAAGGRASRLPQDGQARTAGGGDRHPGRAADRE